MSKWFSMILCVVLLSVLSACGGGSADTSKSTSAAKGVSFSFSKDALVSAKSAKTLSSTAGTLNPAAKYAVISATDANGNPVLTDQQTDIYTLSGSYVTATIPINPGTYNITKFWVLDSNNNILYLVPTQSASDDIKRLITNLLPISFTVATDTTNTVALQVLAPDNSTPQDFGYPSFSFSIVNYVKLMTCVQTQVGANSQLIAADLAVNGVIYNHAAVTTTLRVAQADSYTLVFSKSGYLSKTLTLSATDIASYQSTPLVVVMTVAPNYTVAFNSNGGSAVSSQTVVAGNLAARPADPTKSGYSFAGWYVDPGLAAPAFDFTTPINSNLTLNAKWTLIPTYTVAFDSNGGSAVPPQTIVSGNLASRPADPAKSGYSFAGWYADPGFSGTPFDFSTPITSNLTLYAKWTPPAVQSVSLTFRVNGDYTAVGTATGLSVAVPTGHDAGTTPSYNVTLPALAKNVVVSCFGGGGLDWPGSGLAHSGDKVQSQTLTGILGVPLDLFVGQGAPAGSATMAWADGVIATGSSSSIYLHGGTVLKMLAGGGDSGGSDNGGPVTKGPYFTNTLGDFGGTVTTAGGGAGGRYYSGGANGWITVTYDL
jgi:uncharacterized repeat protein (TIGR02543 family)